MQLTLPRQPEETTQVKMQKQKTNKQQHKQKTNKPKANLQNPWNEQANNHKNEEVLNKWREARQGALWGGPAFF